MKKLICMILAALMVFLFVACGTVPDDSILENSSTGQESVNEQETENPNFVCDLPTDLNYNNTEVTILYAEMDGRLDELVSEGYTGSTISDAVYERNLAVEDRLNVRLSFVGGGHDVDVTSKMQNVVQGGDDSLELFSVASWQAIPLASSGMYLDLNRIENVNLSKQYWVQKYNELVTFTEENRQFMATSYAALSMYRLAYLTIFNKALMAEQKLPNLYDLVNNGEWTLERQYDLIADVYVDMSGDSKAGDGDFYGFLTGPYVSVDTYCTSSNIHLITRDESGYYTLNSDKMNALTDMVDRVHALYGAQGTYVCDMTDDDLGSIDGKGFKTIEMFAEQKGLMATTLFLRIERRFDMLADVEYGIVPMPKLTVEQTEYSSYVQDQISAFGILASVGDEDRQAVLGAVMEAMAYYSYGTVRPAYYESALSLRFMQDVESREMLDTIVASFSFDYCYYTDLGGIRSEMRNILPNKNASIASKVKSWEKKIRMGLEREKISFEKKFG